MNRQQSDIKVTYRDIARMFARALPVEYEEFGSKVEEYLKVIKDLPVPAKLALRTAYVFSRKVPKAEREDLYQDLVVALLESRTKDARLAYAIARCDWKNWWSKYTIRQHYSLDSVVNDGEGNTTTLGELLVGECEFEAKVCSKLHARSIMAQLPPAIRTCVIKRLTGRPLAKGEGEMLSRWGNKNLQLLASLSEN
jgi:DNA-directed RNA polymerase specialized sigma24 family protein